MNPQALYVTLNSIPSDSSKNKTLKSVIPAVQGLDWSHISDLVGCYSSDSSKVEAIGYLTTKSLTNYNDDFVPKILRAISSDSSKVKALDKLSEFIVNPFGAIISNVVSTISSDSSKCEAVAILMNRFEILSDVYIRGVLSNITSDSSTVKALKHLVSKINTIEDSTLLGIVQTISSDSSKAEGLNIAVKKTTSISAAFACAIINNIHSDSSKINGLNAIVSKMTITFNCVFGILKNISSDSSKLSALKTFIEYGYKSNEHQLIDLLSTASSSSTKSEFAISLSSCMVPISNYDIISDHDLFCESLAKAIDDYDYYLKVTNKFNLNCEYVEKYKPEKRSFDIHIDNMSFNSNSCDVSIPSGVYCTSSTLVTNNGEIHYVKEYSNGMVVQTQQSKNGHTTNIISGRNVNINGVTFK